MVITMQGGNLPRQAHLPGFTDKDSSLLNARLEHKAAQAVARKERIAPPKVVEPNRFQLVLNLLFDPLFEGPCPIEISPALSDLCEDLGDTYGDVGPNVHSDDPDADEVVQGPAERVSDQFSDVGVATLHIGLLEHSLAVLAGRGNPMEKAETLRWFFLPDIRYWVQKKVAPDESEVLPPRPILNSVVKHRPVRAVDLPFTFQRCCAYAGVSHEDVLERLRHILRKAGLGQYMPA